MVGIVGFTDLSQARRRVDKCRRGAVHSVLYSREACGTTLRARDHFLTSLRDRAKPFLLGARLVLATATAPSLGTAAGPSSSETAGYPVFLVAPETGHPAQGEER